jgi:hypothetical protein
VNAAHDWAEVPINILVAVKELAPSLSVQAFDCEIIKHTAGVLIGLATDRDFGEVAQEIDCKLDWIKS